MIKTEGKRFEDLTLHELYELLKARAAVFVVEQTCVYQDLDDADQTAVHVLLKEGDVLKAYLRILPGKTEGVKIGRVLTLDRGKGYGGRILSEAIRIAFRELGAACIELDAQCYASGFYEREGFVICSEPFLEDGIPHIKMRLEKK